MSPPICPNSSPAPAKPPANCRPAARTIWPTNNRHIFYLGPNRTGRIVDLQGNLIRELTLPASSAAASFQVGCFNDLDQVVGVIVPQPDPPNNPPVRPALWDADGTLVDLTDQVPTGTVGGQTFATFLPHRISNSGIILGTHFQHRELTGGYVGSMALLRPR